MNEKTIVLTFSDKDPKNHSVRWNADDKDAALSSIYIRKPFLQGAKRIRVTVEEAE